MRDTKMSSTAVLTTVLRAMHQTIDGEPKILVDPVSEVLAKYFEGSAEWTAFSGLSPEALSAARSAVVLRSRVTEDVLHEVAGCGPCQYVIMGAGFDSFAYRQPPWAKAIPIFEVDHPATQESKREVLRDLAISRPDNLRLCPVDFETTSLSDALARATFEFDVPSVFSWLGVTNYITEASIRSTLEFIRSMPPSSTVVFSFVPTDAALRDEDRRILSEIGRLAAGEGEPFISRFDPQELAELVSDIGFGTVDHLLPEVVADRYFKGRADGLPAPSAEQLMKATV
jgi:methyltransferase (TIGR00027 family)